MRKSIMKIIAVFLLFITSTSLVSASDVLYIVLSPDGKLKVELSNLSGNSLLYRVYYDNQQIIQDSKLGLKFISADLTSNLTFVSSETNEINEMYTLPSGKVKDYTNHCNELKTTFRRLGNRLVIVFRVFNDGFAFRYEVPSIGNLEATDLQNEESQIRVDGFRNSWAQSYRLDYSGYYESRDWNKSAEQKDFCAPVLVKTSNQWLLLTESANYGTFATSMIRANEEEGTYSFQRSKSESVSIPLETPWRTVILGNLPAIMKSTMVENLNPPTEIDDLSWVIPGRSSWDWGGEDAWNAIGYDVAVRYIDFAHEMNWEYFTLDDGWENADYELQDVIDYATSKGVKIILWSHHNKFSANKDQIRAILKEWKDMGIAGVKVDFWESDDVSMMKKYDTFMEVATEQKLLVNLHGCTKPSGTRRKWPNLLTAEAVLGGEMYLFNSQSTPASHNINLTMTRNVIGSMDYTPCDFGSKSGGVKQNTSWSHQLALVTAFESGLQCYIDKPENYRYHTAQSFMERIPVAWDEIVPIEAAPESYVTIARRSENDWYVASLANEARVLNLNLSFLESGKKYCAYIYKDGECMSEIDFDFIENLNNGKTLNIPILQSGGATIHLSTSTDYPKPKMTKYEGEAGENAYPRKEKDPDNKCSGGEYISYIGKGQNLVFNNIKAEKDDLYALSVYYMAGEDRNLFIKVNDSEFLPYNLKSSSGWNGNHMSFTTILIPLKEGNNTIVFGNEQGYAPNIDRITIKSLKDDSSFLSSITGTIEAQLPKIYSKKGELIVIAGSQGVCNIFNVKGEMIQQSKISNGENSILIATPGIYILNVTIDSLSYSVKQFVK